MKTIKSSLLVLGCLFGLALLAHGQADDSAAAGQAPAAPPSADVAPPGDAPEAPPNVPDGATVIDSPAAQAPAAPAPEMPADQQSDSRRTTPAVAEGSEPRALPPIKANNSTNMVALKGDKNLRLNFRGVPLEMVLNYLSDAAGFIIILDTQVSGKVDVWSNQPLSKQEAVDLLNTVLEKNGYAAIRNGRTLTIVSRSEAKKKNIAVKSGSNPDQIPKNDEIVTQIIPIRSLNAVQLTKDLDPLLPPEATLTANESGNALVMTDKQSNIHRMTEIIKALDSLSSSVNVIRVFPLRFADAKALTSVIKDLFPAADASGSNGGNRFGRSRFGGGGGGGFPGFGGGGGFPGLGGGGNGGQDSSANGHTPTQHVMAVSDDHSNSLIVSAPEDIMDTVAKVVESVDKSVEEDTEVRVFPLHNADPTEMAELLGNLFPDENGSSDASRSPIQFGGFGGRFLGGLGGLNGGARGNAASQGGDTSDRMKKLGRVVAVADRRTASLVVSTSKELMPQIEAMISKLDDNPARKQKVRVYTLKNADVADVQQVLSDLFPSGSGTSANRNNANQASSNPLLNRLNTTLQQQQSSSQGTGFGSSSFGGNTTGRGF